MLINEVCRECTLTKKAVEYYIEQGLVAPAVLENGYRDFSGEDTDRLKKIFVLRGLGASTAEIRRVLSGRKEALDELCRRKELDLTFRKEKQKLIAELAKEKDFETVRERLLQLQKKQTVLERLLNAFPGNYGRFVCLRFAPYLDEPVTAGKQQEAFETILSFLDQVDFDIPDDLRNYMDEITEDYDKTRIEEIYSGLNSAIRNMEVFLEDNQQTIESYMACRQSEEYKATQLYRLEEAMRRFNRTSGYNDIFIPAMRRLSGAYDEYQKALEEANEKLLMKYPKWTFPL